MKNGSILIVDDYPKFADELKLLLQESNHIVTIATTSEIALQSLKEKAIDLVILDTRIEGKNGAGLRLARKIDELDEWQDGFIIVMEANATKYEVIEGIRNPLIRGWFEKSNFNLKEFLDTVDWLINTPLLKFKERCIGNSNTNKIQRI